MTGADDTEASDDPWAPRRNPGLVGHQAAEATLVRWAGSGRLPHAIMLAGPYGIGKATLAFRLARYLMAQSAAAPEPGLFGAPPPPDDLAVSADHPVARRIASGGHADLFTLERRWDDKRQKRRDEILVDDVRALSGFMHLTPAEGGWRIVIIDGAESMNRNAMNALLKLLEEPPRETLLLLVTAAPGRLLPTVRSRCRLLTLQPLATEDIVTLLGLYRPDIAAADRPMLAGLAHGSIGRALDLADAGGLALHAALLDLLARLPAFDAAAAHRLGETMQRGEAAGWTTLTDLLLDLVGRLCVGAIEGASRAVTPAEAAVFQSLATRAPARRWLGTRDHLLELFERGEALHLDRKHMLLDAITRLAGTGSPNP